MEKNLIFNELSEEPIPVNKHEGYQRLELLLKVYKIATNHGFKGIRFDKTFDKIYLSERFTLEDYCNDTNNRTYKSILLAIRRYPFIDDSDTDVVNEFIENEYYLAKNDLRIKCTGLAAAYLYSTCGIGFLSESFWNDISFSIIIKNSTERQDTILCLSNEQHLNCEKFREFIDNCGDVCLCETPLPIEKKEINLRNDHGYDILEKFAKRLIRNEYIVKVINSLPFNPSETNFIKKVYHDGKIEVVLTDTDRGLGMIIQTTGRNLRETTEISKIIYEKFGK